MKDFILDFLLSRTDDFRTNDVLQPTNRGFLIRYFFFYHFLHVSTSKDFRISRGKWDNSDFIIYLFTLEIRLDFIFWELNRNKMRSFIITESFIKDLYAVHPTNFKIQVDRYLTMKFLKER